jgi:hypothetical protein
MKKQAAVKLERIKALIESGDNIRVSAIKALRPSVATVGNFEDVDDFYVDIVREQAPGLFTQIFTVPQALLEQQEDYPNLAGPTPKSQIREDETNIKPEEAPLSDTDASDFAPYDNPDARDLPTSNTDLGSKEPTPGESYTKKYLDQHPYSKSAGDLS